MGFSLEINKYNKETNAKIREENKKYGNEEEFNWYENIFRLDEGGERICNKKIECFDAYYSLFKPLEIIICLIFNKRLSNFKMKKGLFEVMGIDWEIDENKLKNKDKEFFWKHISFLKYAGGSGGWTWTYEEIKDLKDLLIEEDQYEKLSEIINRKNWDDKEQSLKDIFELVIKNEAVLELW